MKTLNTIFNFQPLSRKDVTRLQYDLKIVLPEKYIEFIQQNNGGRFKETLHKTSRENVIICDFLPLEDANNEAVKDYLPLVNDAKAEIKWLPFGFDPGGWVFCISLQEETYGQVFLFRMDKIYEEAFDFVCGGFEEFINGLKMEEDI